MVLALWQSVMNKSVKTTSQAQSLVKTSSSFSDMTRKNYLLIHQQWSSIFGIYGPGVKQLFQTLDCGLHDTAVQIKIYVQLFDFS